MTLRRLDVKSLSQIYPCYNIVMEKTHYRPHHTAISVRNLHNSLKFYKALGYEQVHRYDEDDGSMTIVHLKLGSSFLEIFAYKKNENSARCLWLV